MKAATIPPKAAWIKPIAILPERVADNTIESCSCKAPWEGASHGGGGSGRGCRGVSGDICCPAEPCGHSGARAVLVWRERRLYVWSGAYRFLPPSILPSTSLPRSFPSLPCQLGASLQSLHLSKAPHTAYITVKEWCGRAGGMDMATGRGGWKEVERHKEKRKALARKNEKEDKKKEKRQ